MKGPSRRRWLWEGVRSLATAPGTRAVAEARRPLIEELEPRVLLSADLPGVVDVLVAAPLGAGAEGVHAPTLEAPAGSLAAETARREIVFVDAGVEGYETLVADLRARSDAAFEVIILDPERDGIAQISAALADARDVDGVHVISHGNDRGVQLGATWLTDDTLGDHADRVAEWGAALAADADLLFYGCNLAASAEGQSLLGSLASLTGADVAASADLTGAAQLGGDWVLEYATGAIQSEVALSVAAQASFAGVLDGTAVWSDGVTATPVANPYSNAADDFVGPGPTTPSGGPWRIVTGAEAPTRDEKIVLGLDASRNVSGMLFDGVSWTALPMNDLVLGQNGDYAAFAVAYESQTGHAMVVWSNAGNGSKPLSYQIWDGATWSAAATITAPTFGEASQMKLAASPLTDEMVLVVSNKDKEDYALVWDGASWGNGIALDDSTGAPDRTDINVAYEQATGRAMVVYGNDGSSVDYRLFSSGTWSAESSVAAPAGVTSTVRWTFLDADPTSDRLVLGAISGSDDSWFSIWDGGSWQPSVLGTASGGHNDLPNAAVAFEAKTGEALVVWGESDQDVHYRTWSVGGGWSAAADGPDVDSKPNTMILSADPTYGTIMLLAQNATEGLNASLWDGFDWEGKTTLLTSSTGESKLQPFTYLWDQNSAPNIAPTLTPASPDLTRILAHQTDNAGDTIASILGASVADPDDGAREGIAVTALSKGNGTWEYLVGDGDWTDVGTLNSTSALLLRPQDRLRFIPGGLDVDKGGFTYRAWDQTTGVVGTKVDVTLVGGNTAFSLAADTATIDVSTSNQGSAFWSESLNATVQGNPYDGASFGVPGGTVNASGPFRVMTGAESPTRDEQIIVGVDALGNLSAQISVNGTWLAIPDFETVTRSDRQGFDVVYETDGGRAMLVYNNGTNGFGSLSYRIWDGSSLSGPTTITTPFAGEAEQIQLAADPSSNEMVVVVSNADNEDYAIVWDGSSWGNSISLDNGFGVASNTEVQVVYEALSGRAMVLYGEAADSVSYRVWTGSSWTPEGTLTEPGGIFGSPLWMSVDADPNGNRIVLGVTTTATESWTAIWDGSSWGQLDKTAPWGPGTDASSIAVAFESQSGEALAVYSKQTFNELRYRTWTVGSGWSGEQVGPNLGIDPNTITLDADPFSNQIMLSVQDDAQVLTTIPWGGRSFGTPVAQGAATGETNNQPFLFLWDQQAPIDALWLTTSGHVNGGGQVGADEWEKGDLVELTGPGFALEPGVTGGTFSVPFDYDLFASVQRTDAVHYVGRDIQVGASAFQLRTGDLLLSIEGPDTLVSTATAVDVGFTNSLAVTAADVFVFRPETPGDYSNGTFAMLLQDAFGTAQGVAGVSLVEHTTLVGDATLDPGDFLLVREGSSENVVWLYDTTDVAIGGTAGSVLNLIDGGDDMVDIGGKLNGIELVESTLVVGGRTLHAGSLLLSLEDLGEVGHNELASGGSDIFVLDVTRTSLVAGSDNGAASASLLFEGADAAFDSNQETLNGFTLTVSSGSPSVVGNVSPVLTPFAPTLASINEDATGNIGQTVASVVGASISDANADPDGISIHALSSGNGAWQYDTGSGWTAVGSVSASSALVLGTSHSIRFVPDAENADSASFSYRAWDGSNGAAAGTKVDATSTGGATAFSVASDTASITVSAVNDAPTLVATTPGFPGITEDDTSNTGVAVSSLLGGAADVDAAAAAGIAITTLSEANGVWQMKIAAGAWADVGSVSATNALLLRSTDRIRFLPDGDNGGISNFTFLAWDQTSGSAGAKVDPGAGGGTSAFSTGSDTAAISVSPRNDAPTLSVTAPSLPALSEDDVAVAGVAVSTLLGGVSDVDGAASEGLAITTVSGNGTWQYRLAAGAWTDVGAVSGTSALLLRDSDEVRYLPDGANGETASFGFRAWDQASGSAGAKVDPGVGGGTSAFSTGGDTASVTVSSANDAPVLTPATPTFPAITENDTSNTGITVGTLVGASVADVDTSPAEGIAVTALGSGGGTWQYRLGAGAWTDVGAVTATSALLLQDTDRLRFVPDGDNGETPDPTVSYRAWDQTSGTAGTKVNPGAGGGTSAFSSASDTGSVSVSSVNDAPVRAATAPTLPAIDENATGNGGVLVSSVLGPVTDPDTGAVDGMAITALSGNGTWQYRLGAGAWTDVGAVTGTSALLLRSGDGVRYVPDTENGETASFDFRVWDQTTGSAGAKVDPGVGGGSTAFSTTSDTASISVTHVNDAPVLVATTPSLPGISEDTGTGSAGVAVSTLLGGVSDVDGSAATGLAITGITANGTWQYRLGAGAWTDVGAVSATSALLLRSTDSVRFVPDGMNGETASFDFRAWDQTTGSAGTKPNPGVGGSNTAFSTASDTASITVADANDAPTLAGTTPALPGITEDDTNEPGVLVSTLLGGVGDPDSGAASGLAITGITANGTWQYRLASGAWTDVGTVSATSALLLRSTDSVRFVPDGANGETASFDFRAWDQTTGSAGTKVAPGVGGGTTAFSTGSDTASVSVSDVNDAPVLDTSGNLTLSNIVEDSTNPAGNTVAQILASDGGTPIDDVDAPSAVGIAVTGVNDTNGTWEYRLGAGAWTGVGAVDADSALLLRSTDALRFVPDTGYTGSAGDLVFHAWDQTTGSVGGIADPTPGGGSTAFSTATQTATLTVTPTNDAPVLNPIAPSFPTISEDETGNPGQTVALLVGASISDTDAGAVEGIAVTGLASGNGTWQYRLGSGAWSDVGAVSATSALLLTDADRLRFVPDGANAESPDPSVTYHAWDQNSGSAGSKVNMGAGGGGTAFSTASDTASISVTAVNDAPTLAVTGPTMPGITEDETSNAGVPVSTLLGGVGDVDTGAAGGLAITGATGSGTWQVRLGAGAWTDLGAVSASNALLLRDTDSVRYVPDGANGEGTDPRIVFRAWDQSSGSAGSKVNPGTGGGSSAFSLGSDSATIAVSSVNDAPTLAATAPSLPSITEDDTASAGVAVSTLLGGASDPDVGASRGIAITGTAGNGTWQYRIGAGLWTDVGAVSGTSAMLLGGSDLVRYVPDTQNGETASFDFRGWDQVTGAAGTTMDPGVGGGTTAFSTGSDTASITVTSVNDAPTLTPAAPALPGISEDAVGNPGVAIASLVGGSITDVDASAFTGIAVTSLASGNGSWEYSTDAGASWLSVGTASDASALLLRDVDLVRFVPDGKNADTAGFGFRAWDQSSGAAGGRGSALVPGGSTAFSVAADSASIAVSAVNDAPSIANASLATLPGGIADPNGATVAALFGPGFSDVDSGATLAGVAIVGNPAAAATQGVWEYSSDGLNWFAIATVGDDSTALALSSGTRVRFVPAAGFSGAAPSLVLRGLDNSYAGVVSATTLGIESRATVDASLNGGSTPISGATVTLSHGSVVPPVVIVDPGTVDPPTTGDGDPTDPGSDPSGGDDESGDDESSGTGPTLAPPDEDGPAITPPVSAGVPGNGGTVRGAAVVPALELEEVRHRLEGVAQGALQAAQQLLEIGSAGALSAVDLSDLIFEQQRAEFYDELDGVREELGIPMEIEARVVGSAVAVTTGLSVGYVVWLTRGGLLLASLVSSMPAWRLMDPLPILAGLAARDSEDDESLEGLVDRGNEAREGEEDEGTGSPTGATPERDAGPEARS